MQIRFAQFHQSLNKSAIPVLLISGDEPYQNMLAADKYRSYVQDLGYSERKVLVVESGFDWSELELAKNNRSLFDDRTLIDLRILSGKPGVSGSKAIVKFINDLHQDVNLLIQAPRLDRNTMNSAWVKAVDKAGIILRTWPLNEIETKNWIKEKLEAKGFSVTNDVVAFIVQHVEGNLLAAMQEIDKIALICETKRLDIQVINSALTNSSHYSLNELMDALSRKDLSRLVRILKGLEKEDIAPPLLLWGLTEQIRKIVDVSDLSRQYQSVDHYRALIQLSNTHQQLIGIRSGANTSKSSDLLKQCAWVDRVIKGRANGNPWHELLQLSIAAQITA